jgi:tetratricopeptide (TPR) repeat protein
MSKYNRKKKNQAQDEFVSFWERAFAKAEPYARAIGITLASAVGVVLVVSAVTSRFEHKAQAATEELGRAVRVYDAELLTGDNPPAPKVEEENPIPRFKTDKERAEATLKQLKDYKSDPKLERQALLFSAGVLFDLGRYDDAEAEYKKVLSSGDDTPMLAVLAKESLGLVAEAKNRPDDALTAYQALAAETQKPGGEFFRDRAWFDQARVYAKKGDAKKAIELYKDILAKTPTSSLREEVQNKLTALEAP